MQGREGGAGKEECVRARGECVCKESVQGGEACVCVKYVCPALSHFLSFSLLSVI